MKIELDKACSGMACGKQNIRFTDDNGKTIGYIQPTHLEWYGMCGTLQYIVQPCWTKWKIEIFGSLAEAIKYLFDTDAMEKVDEILNEMVRQIGSENVDKEMWRR